MITRPNYVVIDLEPRPATHWYNKAISLWLITDTPNKEIDL